MKTIPLSQGQVAIVDDEDYDVLSKFKWCAIYDPQIQSFYAVRKPPHGAEKRALIRMHRVVMDAQDGQQVDHQNHDTLDNQRLNLRLTDNQGNGRNRRLQSNNRSGCSGVSWIKSARRWRACIKVAGKRIHLGEYTDKHDAIAARQAANIQHGFHPNHGRRFHE